jgi:hypothetical protein
MMNFAPFVFANVAEMYVSQRSNWRLFENSRDVEAWGAFGLIFYLSIVPIAVLFASLIRRCSVHVPFLAFFICVSLLLSFVLYTVAVGDETPRSFVLLFVMAWFVEIAFGLTTCFGKLKEYQDVIFGVMLFSFSPAYIYLIFFVTMAFLVNVPSTISFWVVMLLFCVGMGLNELTFTMSRRARRYAS